MFNSILKGVANSVVDLATSVTEVSVAATSIVGSYTQGEEIRKQDVTALLTAGFSVIEIASFFGVAERVITELLKEEQ